MAAALALNEERVEKVGKNDEKRMAIKILFNCYAFCSGLVIR